MLKQFMLGLALLVSATFTFTGCTRDQGAPAAAPEGAMQAPAADQAAPAADQPAAPAEGEAKPSN